MKARKNKGDKLTNVAKITAVNLGDGVFDSLYHVHIKIWKS